MKKTLFLASMLLFAIASKAQTIVPLEKKIDYKLSGNEVPDGTYFKDVNNLLDKYVGVWKGELESKKYVFFITKYKYTSKIYNVAYDKLKIHYLVTNSLGATLKDTRIFSDDSRYVIKGDYFSKNLAYYVCNYFGEKTLCGDIGTLFLRIKNPRNTLMSVALVRDPMLIAEDTCPGFKLVELGLPKEGLKLTKE